MHVLATLYSEEKNAFAESFLFVAFPLNDKNLSPFHTKGGYRLDVVVEELVILELKAVERIEPIHEAQLLTYLKLSNLKSGILLNFNVPVLKNGIKRIVNNL